MAAHAMSMRTTMLSLCGLKISYVFKFKISITLHIFPNCRGAVETFPTAKLTKIFENEGVTAKKIADYDTPDTERAKLS